MSDVLSQPILIGGRRLTVRQAEVFQLVGRGRSYVETAKRLKIGYATVVTYARQVHGLLKGYEQMPPKAAIRHFYLVAGPSNWW